MKDNNCGKTEYDCRNEIGCKRWFAKAAPRPVGQGNFLGMYLWGSGCTVVGDWWRMHLSC